LPQLIIDDQVEVNRKSERLLEPTKIGSSGDGTNYGLSPGKCHSEAAAGSSDVVSNKLLQGRPYTLSPGK
jgi:hypothetical protein